MERTIRKERPKARRVMAALIRPMRACPHRRRRRFHPWLEGGDLPAEFRGTHRGEHGHAPHGHGQHAVISGQQGFQAGILDFLTDDLAGNVLVSGVGKDAPTLFKQHEVAGLAEVHVLEAGGKPRQGNVHAEHAGEAACRVKHLVGDGKDHLAGIGEVALRNAADLRGGFARHIPGPPGHVEARSHLRIVKGGGVVAVLITGVDLGIVRIGLVHAHKFAQHVPRRPGKVLVAKHRFAGRGFVGGEGVARGGHVRILGQERGVVLGRVQELGHINAHKAQLPLDRSAVSVFRLLAQRKGGVGHDARRQEDGGEKKAQNNAQTYAHASPVFARHIWRRGTRRGDGTAGAPQSGLDAAGPRGRETDGAIVPPPFLSARCKKS
jgi:hypothetical protein